MTRRTVPFALAPALAAAAALLAPSSALLAQTSAGGWGRVSLFGQAGSTRAVDGGAGSSFNDAWATLTLRSSPADSGGLEYALDGRGRSSAYGDERQSRAQLYDAWVGGRLSGGAVGARVGQMWLNDLGALGAVGGLNLEWRPLSDGKPGRFRLGVFGGLEPNAWEAGYVQGVTKAGAYAVLEGERARRHVLGWVLLRDKGLTERSVVTVTNFVPAGTTFFLYQAAEADLTGPGGTGHGGLTFFFVNARWAPTSRVELTATVHHGRSIDTRTITQDQLDGRPIDAKRLDGLLYESAGGRLSVEVVRGVRLWAGYARERTNNGETGANRTSAGLFVFNLLKSGFDVNAVLNRYDAVTGPFDSWYASLGRSIGARVYLSADYSTAVSVLRTASDGGIVVETRPRSRRMTLSGTFNLTRSISLLLSGERLLDDTSTQNRGMAGLTYRF